MAALADAPDNRIGVAGLLDLCLALVGLVRVRPVPLDAIQTFDALGPGSRHVAGKRGAERNCPEDPTRPTRHHARLQNRTFSNALEEHSVAQMSNPPEAMWECRHHRSQPSGGVIKLVALHPCTALPTRLVPVPGPRLSCR